MALEGHFGYDCTIRRTGVRRRARSKQAGFTLIELAVVIVVIALLLGSILVPLTSQVEQRKVLETQKTLDEIKEALIGFAMINGRLPRPATSSSDGTERGNCTTELECTGFIPWTALGVSKVDSYGKIIRYSVTPAFANGRVYASHCRNQNGKDKGRQLCPHSSRRRYRQLSSHKAQITGAPATMAAR